MTEVAPPPAQTRTTLSKELSEFLVELSIGVHRFAMYPPGHPSLEPVLENIVGRLAELFIERRTLSVGVAQRQLVIEGVATEQRHALLGDLARRLHDHHLGAITFERGVNVSQVEGVLRALAADSERQGTPIGLMSQDDFPRWEHVTLHRVGYDRLQLSESDRAGGELDRVNSLWLGLARAALATEPEGQVSPDVAVVARGIQGHRAEDAYDQVIVGYLLQIADELKGARGQEPEKVRRRVSKLIGELDDDTLARLVGFGGDAEARNRFLLDANQSLAVDSVVKILGAAANAREQGISHSMTRLLSKLAVHAEQGEGRLRSQADTALRENVESLIAGWELKDPNPEAYTTVLDTMARAAPIFQAQDEEGAGERLSGAQRLVEMALEVDAFGPSVEKAIADVLEAGGAGTLLNRVRELPASNRVADRIRTDLTDPARFRHLLAEGRVDDDALRTLVEEMGSLAVDPLLEVLADSDSRAVRRRVFDALAGMGTEVGERALTRLQDGRWFVLRNMLSLLQRLEPLPAGFDPQAFLEHKDPRVRREAFPLALRRGSRDRTLATALADSDERIVRMALLELQEAVPDPILPTLVNRVVLATDRPGELRTMGLRALARSRSPLAFNTLLGLATAGKTMFGRPKLASPSAESVAALRALAQGWGDRDEVREIVQQAQRSKEVDLRNAVQVDPDSGDGSEAGR